MWKGRLVPIAPLNPGDHRMMSQICRVAAIATSTFILSGAAASADAPDVVPSDWHGWWVRLTIVCEMPDNLQFRVVDARTSDRDGVSGLVSSDSWMSCRPTTELLPEGMGFGMYGSDAKAPEWVEVDVETRAAGPKPGSFVTQPKSSHRFALRPSVPATAWDMAMRAATDPSPERILPEKALSLVLRVRARDDRLTWALYDGKLRSVGPPQSVPSLYGGFVPRPLDKESQDMLDDSQAKFIPADNPAASRGRP